MLAKLKGILKPKSIFLILVTITVGVFLYFQHTSQLFPAATPENVRFELTSKIPEATTVSTTPLLPATTPKPEYKDDLHYFPDTMLHFSKKMLDENFDLCFFEPFVANKDNMNSSLKEFFSNFTGYKDFRDSTAKIKTRTFPFFILLLEFADLMSMLNVETVLLEPSILFCMLSPAHKNLLLKRKFDLNAYIKSTEIVTFGIGEKDVPTLEKAEIQAQLKMAGFRVTLIHEDVEDWMEVSESSKDYFTSHIFFTRNILTVHMVVFYKRGYFLWHAAMQRTRRKHIPPLEELNFAEEDSAYDSLTAVFIEFKDGALSNISIPSNSQHFLLEMTTSKFLECNTTVVENFVKGLESKPKTLELIRNKTRSLVDQQWYERRLVVALRELKAKFNPLLIRFWIWAGTLLGWYRQCGVIPYTGDVDFAAWAGEVEDLEQLLNLFRKNEHLKLKERMGLVDIGLELNLNCHSVRVDIFFLYTDVNGTWYAGHRPSKGYYFKYRDPHFTLCSAELLEHKVLVPCEADAVLTSEYGPDWMTPVTSWNYETTSKNRGPNIYWDKELLKKVYAW